MSEPDDPLVKRSAERYSVERILAPSNRGSLVMIGGIVIVVAVAFAYTGGFLSPNRLTPTKVVNQFEADTACTRAFVAITPKGCVLPAPSMPTAAA